MSDAIQEAYAIIGSIHVEMSPQTGNRPALAYPVCDRAKRFRSLRGTHHTTLGRINGPTIKHIKAIGIDVIIDRKEVS